MTFWKFLSDNWLWILIGLFVFGGSIAEFFGSFFSHLGPALSGRGKNKALKAEIKYLKRENSTLRGLMESKGAHPNALTAMTHEAELVDIVSRVQATDEAWPQIPLALRNDIDRSLERYRHRKVS